jgi:hypothetical protein
MTVVGVTLMGIGLVLVVYNSIAYEWEVRGSKIETELEPGEQIKQVFRGGYMSFYSTPMGKWCITNKRLIFEGVKPGGLFMPKSDRDVTTFPLKTLVRAEIVEKGRFDKFLEVTFKRAQNKTTTVKIVCEKLQEFKDMLEKTQAQRKRE